MDTRRLDLNLLVTLEALLAERNVTRASERLHLSQPAVSAQLARLRALFGDPLLIPARRGMTPTAKALELLEPLREALDRVRGTLGAHASFDPATAERVVAIACTDYLQTVLLAPLAIALRTRAPGLRVAIRQLDPARLEAQMARGEVDLALMTPSDAPAGLRSRPLFEERYVLVGRRRHPRLRKQLGVDDFAQLEHIVVSPRGGGFASPVDAALAALRRRRTVVLSAASFLFVVELVAESNFVALVPERLARARAGALRIAECPFAVPGFTVAMVWHERNHAHAAQRWLRETLATLADGT